MSERCLLCGGEIPEGRQVCPECEKQANEKPALGIRPYFLAIPGRIKELAEAISRNATDTNGLCIRWAEEIICHSRTLEKMGGKYEKKL